MRLSLIFVFVINLVSTR